MSLPEYAPMIWGQRTQQCCAGVARVQLAQRSVSPPCTTEVEIALQRYRRSLALPRDVAPALPPPFLETARRGMALAEAKEEHAPCTRVRSSWWRRAGCAAAHCAGSVAQAVCGVLVSRLQGCSLWALSKHAMGFLECVVITA